MAKDQLEFGDDQHSMALKRAWERALIVLAGKVNKVTFESYIRPIRPLFYREQEVALGVASPFAREWLDKRYGVLIRATLESILGSPVDLHLRVLSAEDRPLLYPDDGSIAPSPSPEPPPAKAPILHAVVSEPEEDPVSLPLNERYTFENFVVGQSNRFAQAGAMAVANAPGTLYNPLFIYGGSGLGKTHLLHAIGNAVRSRNAAAHIAFMDGEAFTHHYVTALRERKTEEFRRYYRSVDVWLVDDIQFIAGREQTKEEFFHTFNALYQTGRQIVIASDRSPRELRAMDERLRSRFECGLITDINPPELETRVAIMERRCLQEGWPIPKEVIYHIASALQSNIRALEGALTKLVAYSSIMNCSISIELAQSVLGEFFIDRAMPSGRTRKGVSVETILRAVAEALQTNVEALRSQRRDKHIAFARQVAMYLCRELTETPLAQIGAAVGGRDHTTVQRAITKIEALLPYDTALRNLLQQIQQQLDQ